MTRERAEPLRVDRRRDHRCDRAQGVLAPARSPQAALARIDALEGDVHALNQVTPDLAYAAADRIDALVAAGENLPAARGVPAAFKDNMNLIGTRTTCSSRILANYESAYDCTAVARMVAAGVLPLGKCNMDEFAFGSSGETSATGPRQEPVGPRAHPGRFERGQRGGGRRGPRDRDARLRHGRLDPPARRDDRHRRAQADVRARQPLRLRGVREFARPDRPVLAHRRGQRTRARSDLRQGPDGRHERRAARRGVRRGGHVLPTSPACASAS